MNCFRVLLPSIAPWVHHAMRADRARQYDPRFLGTYSQYLNTYLQLSEIAELKRMLLEQEQAIGTLIWRQEHWLYFQSECLDNMQPKSMRF